MALEHTKTIRQIKCKDCDRIGAFRNGYCYWHRRKLMFNNGFVKLNTGEEYSNKTRSGKSNHKKCKYPNCNEFITTGATTDFCIPHRVMVKVQ